MFVYNQVGFVVVPASSVQGLKRTTPVYGKRVRYFFQEYLMFFIRDPALNGWDDAALKILREKTDYKNAIVFSVKKSLNAT